MDLGRHILFHDCLPDTPPPTPARPLARRPLPARLITPPPSHAYLRDALPPYTAHLPLPPTQSVPSPSYATIVEQPDYMADLLLRASQHLHWVTTLILDYSTGTHTTFTFSFSSFARSSIPCAARSGAAHAPYRYTAHTVACVRALAADRSKFTATVISVYLYYL